MTRKEIERDYDVRGGVIRTPGKFENEPVYSPYYHDLCMISGEDEILYCNDKPYSFFIITAEDRQEFPELNGTYGVVCWESDSGFWFCGRYEMKETYDKDIAELSEQD